MTTLAKIKWEVAFEQKFSAAPLPSDNFVLCALQSPTTRLQALNKSDATLLWQHPLDQESITNICALHRTKRFVISLTGRHFHSQGSLYAINEGNIKIWQWSGSGQRFSAIAPDETESKIFLTVDAQSLLIISARDGKTIKQIPLPVTPSPAAPLICKQTIYLPCRSAQIIAYTLTGQHLWTYQLASNQVAWFAETPCQVNNIVVAVSNSGTTVGLDPTTGKEEWQILLEPGHKGLSPPETDGRYVFIGTQDSVYALDPLSGRTVWQHAIERGVIAKPIVRGGTVTVVGRDHLVRVLEASDGSVLWQYKMHRRIELPPVWLSDRELLVVDEGGNLVSLESPVIVLPVADHDRKQLERLADQYEKEQVWLSAAEIWRKLGRHKRHASLLEAYASNLSKKDAAPEVLAAAWERAADAYLNAGEVADEAYCRREVACHRQLPVIILDVKYTNLQHQVWSLLELTVRNEGFGIAHQLAVQVQSNSEQVAGEITSTKSIFQIAPNQEQSLPLSLYPLQYGPSVPLQLMVSFADDRGHLHTESETICVAVAQSPTNFEESQQLTNVLSNLPSSEEKVHRAKAEESDHYQLLLNCKEFLNKSELRQICLALGIDYEDFPETKSDLILELIQYLARRGRIDQFRQYCRKINPTANW